MAEAAVLDIGMPAPGGYEVCRRMREAPWGKAMLIVAVTGWGQAADRERSVQAGFDHHLVKPVDPLKLVALLRDLAQQVS